MSSAASKPPSAPNAVTAPSSANPPPSSPPEWTETQYITALARLETLQTRIDGLRLTVPTLVRALASPHANPDALFQEFQKVTLGPAKALVGLRRVLEEKETREIMEFVRTSFGNVVDVDGEGLTPFLEEVGRYGWVEELEKIKKEAEGGGEKGKEGSGEVSAVLGDEEMDSKLKAYVEKYEAVTGAEWDRESKIAKIKVQSPAGALSFTIKRTTKENHAIYEVKGPSCKESLRGLSVLLDAVDRSLQSRPHPNDLEYILEMIAAYKDLREAKCDRCKELLDNFAITPAARRSKIVKDEKGVDETVWIALHDSCLPK